MSKESKHVRVFKQQHLRDGEQIKAFADGYIGKLMGKGDDQQFNGAALRAGRPAAQSARYKGVMCKDAKQ